MARAGRARLCPAAAGRRAHESRLGRRPWRLYHASVERRRVAELENNRSHARIACRRGKDARPILFSRQPLGRAGTPVVEQAARRTRARCARSGRAFTLRDAGARHLPRRSLAGMNDALAELAAWFGNAALLLGSIQRQMIGRKLAASPARCWPHHFDLATLTTLPTRNADTTGYIGAGLSPGDEYYDEPYFYVSVYPEPDPAALPCDNVSRCEYDCE